MPIMETLTKSEIDSLFTVNPETGVIFWNVNYHNVSAGSRAGEPHCGNKYNTVCYSGYNYRADQIVWTYVTGKIPPTKLVHIDLARSDDRFNNLILESDVHFFKNWKIIYASQYNKFIVPDCGEEQFSSFRDAKAAYLALKESLSDSKQNA